jgi:mRNA interferase MazF
LPGGEGTLVSEIRQGQVYWLDFGPATSSAPAERHPCVVVQNDIFNRSAIATSVVCLITSNLSRAKAPGNVLLKKGEANLPKASVVNVSQILTVDKAELTECVGNLSGTAAAAVRDGLHLLFDRL